jgi:hypothetical protein
MHVRHSLRKNLRQHLRRPRRGSRRRNALTLLNRDVQIITGPPRRSSRAGRIEMVFAA